MLMKSTILFTNKHKSGLAVDEELIELVKKELKEVETMLKEESEKDLPPDGQMSLL